ncbi:BTB/POZ domain-containing protein 9-like [Watersipora subatra]|uniref:BTB/POZ domain-containing protein 9-like n=1 Tax=Watersipora subatra TaxID=2589382 RepID=UPI00355B036F
MCDHRQMASTYSLGEIDHVQALSDDIGNLYQNEDCSDIVLVVGNETFAAHKVILASRCEYFRALLFGGMSESLPGVRTIELKDEKPLPFSILLSYIYTGRVRLSSLQVTAQLDLLGMANKYGFQTLEASISDHLKTSLTKENVCNIYDMASIYNLDKLSHQCLLYMDRYAGDILKSPGFLEMSKNSVVEVFKRSSFCVDEIKIFEAARDWFAKNNGDPNSGDVIRQVRFSLIRRDDLLRKVRPSGLVDPDEVLDAIDRQDNSKNADLNYRGMLIPMENIATSKYGATVIKGEMRTALLDGDNSNYDLDRGFTRHGIDDDDCDGIVVELARPAIINAINILLWDKDTRSYAYYVDVSMDAKDWIRVVDHRKYLCRSWQRLHFNPRVVKYIKVVGTHNTVNRVFHVIALEAMYSTVPFTLKEGLIMPSCNVATEAYSAFVIEGVARTRNSLINGDLKSYDWDSGYTCHQLGSGAIVVQLAQPFIVDSMKLLLWDCDDRTYSYTVEVSVDNSKWTIITDKSNLPCRSWQTIRFEARPVTFVRIIGTKNSANEVFHLVHFECPCERVTEQPKQEAKLSSSSSPNTHSIPPAPANTSNDLNNSSDSNMSCMLRDTAPPISPTSQHAIPKHQVDVRHMETLVKMSASNRHSQPTQGTDEDEEIWADLEDD